MLLVKAKTPTTTYVLEAFVVIVLSGRYLGYLWGLSKTGKETDLVGSVIFIFKGVDEYLLYGVLFSLIFWTSITREFIRILSLVIGIRLVLMIASRIVTYDLFVDTFAAMSFLVGGLALTTYRYQEERMAFRILFAFLSQSYWALLISFFLVLGAVTGLKSSP